MSEPDVGGVPTTQRLSFGANGAALHPTHHDESKTTSVVEPDTPTPMSAPETPAEIHEELENSMAKSAPNLSDLTVDELKRQQEEIERAILERQQAEKGAVIAQIIEVVNNYNITIEELVEALGGFKPKRKGVKAIAKYRDPVSGTTWSGRGKEPTWMRGHPRDMFLIKDE
jgi:DNA-binding protein H-NS